VLLLLGAAATAQPVEIVSTTPAEDTAGLTADTFRVVFELNKPTPATSSTFVDKFFWTPRDSTSVGLFGHDFDDNDELTLVFFEIEHAPDTDFAWIVYGVEAADGSRMARPFTLNYSTAPTRGDRSIDGAVAPGNGFPTALSASERDAFQARGLRLNALLGMRGEATPTADRRPRALPPAAAAALAGSPQATVARQRAVSGGSLERSAVVLLSDFALNTAFWTGHVATVPSLDGAYSLDDVRPGTYYPVAISYATDEGEQIGAYGYYDADADFSPDPVTVTAGTDLSDVDLTLYSFASSTVLEPLALAEELAADIATDVRLLEVRALTGADQAGSVFPDGTAYVWLYTFYSPATDERVLVAVGPIQASSFVAEAPTGTASQAPLTELSVDSDEALAIADANGGDAFRGQFDNPEEVTVTMAAGALDYDPRPAGGVPFWVVTYTAPESDPSGDELLVFIDPATGDVLDAVPVTNEPAAAPEPSSLVVYPNPVRDGATVRFSLGVSDDVRLDLYDLQGRRVATLAEGIFARGTYSLDLNVARTLPSGTYVLRLHGTQVDQARLVVRLN
jgi:hypothetical protein